MPKFVAYILVIFLSCLWLSVTAVWIDFDLGKLAGLTRWETPKVAPVYPVPTPPVGGFSARAPALISNLSPVPLPDLILIFSFLRSGFSPDLETPKLLAQVGGGNSATLTVSVAGAGSITAEGINCSEGSGDCTETYPTDQPVVLKAVLAGDSESVAWTGCGINPGDYFSCYTIMGQSKTVAAKFYPAATTPLPQLILNLTKAGTDADLVSGDGIWCGSGCSTYTRVYNEDVTVTLTAAPDPGSNFEGWSGDCTGTGDCVIELVCPTSE